MSTMYDNIQKAIRAIEESLNFDELAELLDENQSYLTAEYRPEYTFDVRKTLDDLDNEMFREIIQDTFDDFWISISHLIKENMLLKKKKQTIIFQTADSKQGFMFHNANLKYDDLKAMGTRTVSEDTINPSHYKTDTGVECIEIAEAFPYNIGNAIKYAWRAGKKDDLLQDLKKCQWYIERACERHDYAVVNEIGRDYYVALHKGRQHVDNLKVQNYFSQKDLILNLVTLNLGEAKNIVDKVVTDLESKYDQE